MGHDYDPSGPGTLSGEVITLPKDSQPDNKRARMKKCRGQTPITRENQNQNRTAKKQSIPNNDV